jgi:hypothetical protein
MYRTIVPNERASRTMLRRTGLYYVIVVGSGSRSPFRAVRTHYAVAGRSIIICIQGELTADRPPQQQQEPVAWWLTASSAVFRGCVTKTYYYWCKYRS